MANSNGTHSPDGGHSARLIWSLIAGLALGLLANFLATRVDAAKMVLDGILPVTTVIGQLFLRGMFMVVVPLVFSALGLAIVEIGDLRKLGRLGLTTLWLTAILSASAVLIGVVLVNVLQPGKAISAESRAALEDRFRADAQTNAGKAAQSKPLTRVLVDLLPENPLQEMIGAVDGSSKGNGMLAVMVFSLICGIACAAKPDETAGFVGWLRGLYSISMTVIHFVIGFAPLGAGCLVFTTAAQLGLPVITILAAFVVVAAGGLLLHLFGTYSLVLLTIARRSPRQFFQQSREAMIVAFSTSSSNATLPTAMQVAEENLKLPPKVSNFVLTIGATGNQNGTALFEGVTVLFLAQAMGVELSLAQQLSVVLMAILAGVGTAGVPGGSIPLVVVLLNSVGVPGESIALILGVDRLLDMLRTVVNVTGDLVVATCAAALTPADIPEIPTPRPSEVPPPIQSHLDSASHPNSNLSPTPPQI